MHGEVLREFPLESIHRKIIRLRRPDLRESTQADSRDSNGLIRANGLRVPELNPFFCESRFWGTKSVNRRFEAIRANRSNVVKIGGFLRIDSHVSIHTNRSDSCCESPGHLRKN